MDQRLTENDIGDINFNRADDLFPVMELVAEELVFELVRGGTTDTGSGGLNTLFKVNWKYGKLKLREEWASARWEKILESLRPT
ncbi:hypothetical protein JCM5353_000563 [Sporobolomyces roseus]